MTTGLSTARPRVPPRLLLAVLLLLAATLVPLQVVWGLESLWSFGPAELAQGVLATVGLTSPLEGGAQHVLEWRLWRALAAFGVGSCLAVAGALLQGLFRNGLASPSLIGVTAGASLGATLAILAFAGYGTAIVVGRVQPWWITAAAFAGALGVTLFVVALAGRGPTPVATLLLVGVAINTCIAGVLSAIENVFLEAQAHDIVQAIGQWSFGTIEDRKRYHVALVGAGMAVSAAIVPFVARELDLMGSGEDDARTLGVAVRRTRNLVLVGAAFATACAVATAGQVGFVGLIVPHAVRLAVGSAHRHVLWLSLLGGGVFLLATDLLQLLIAGDRVLHAGVLMSLIGGPLFLALLLTQRKAIAW